MLEGFPLHRGGVAVVVKNDILAAKLTGDDTPATAKDLKLVLAFNADADAEAL
jgi:hypothetical protein